MKGQPVLFPPRALTPLLYTVPHFATSHQSARSASHLCQAARVSPTKNARFSRMPYHHV